jgi:hypothetical protein
VGLVINPRGTSGAGKTWLVREIMAAYRRAGAEPKAIMREGRSRPFGWRLSHPRGGRTLAVIGDYQATRGGTDTIPKTDGGLDQAFRLTQALADDGHDVVLEGYQLSGDHAGTAALAEAQARQGRALHVLCLDVPLEQCVRNVVARRRARQGARPAIERTARAGQEALREACTLLRQSPVTLEWLDAVSALERSLALLGLA